VRDAKRTRGNERVADLRGARGEDTAGNGQLATAESSQAADQASGGPGADQGLNTALNRTDWTEYQTESGQPSSQSQLNVHAKTLHD
jgi:hypothetical protein